MSDAKAKRAKDTYRVPCTCCGACKNSKRIDQSPYTRRCKLIKDAVSVFGVCGEQEQLND